MPKKEKFLGKYSPDSLRLPNYDYGANGLYFVTICTKDRKHFFGGIKNGKMWRTAVGEIVQKCWREIPQHFPFVRLDAFVVMPNHIHGILILEKSIDDGLVATKNFLSLQMRKQLKKRPNGTSQTIGSIVRVFKIGVSKYCRAHTDFSQIWQPNYYEHTIRDPEALQRIRVYILQNSEKWNTDENNLEK